MYPRLQLDGVHETVKMLLFANKDHSRGITEGCEAQWSHDFEVECERVKSQQRRDARVNLILSTCASFGFILSWLAIKGKLDSFI